MSWFGRSRRRSYQGDYGKWHKAKLWRKVALVILAGVIGWFLVSTILFAWYAKDLPQPDKIRRTEGLSTIIYDRNGTAIYDIFRDRPMAFY